MKASESSDNEQEIILDDDTVQFEDLDVPGTERTRRWERFLQRLFARRPGRSWLIGGIVISLVCLILVLAPLLSSLRNGPTPAIADSVHSYLEAVTPQFVYEVQREPGIIRALKRSDGTPVWSYRASAPITDSQALTTTNDSLILSGDALYIHVYNAQFDRVYALHAVTGALLWKYDLSPVFASTALSIKVANGIVYESSFEGDVIALQSQTGKVLWTYRQSGPQKSEDVQFNLVDGIIYLSSQTTQQTQALNALTGLLAWHIYRPSTFITFDSGIIYLEDNFNYLYAFQSHTGALFWKSPDPIFIGNYIITSGDLFISVESDGSIKALHVKTARQAWRTKPSTFPIITLLPINGYIYVVNSDKQHSLLMALNPLTGHVLWQSSDSAFPQVESIGDRVYVKNTHNQLYALQSATGKLLWRSSAGTLVAQLNNVSSTAIDPAFQVADNRVFIGMPGMDNAVILTVLSGSDGHMLWQKSVSSSPLLLAGTVYVTGADGTVYAYMADSGKRIWSTQ